MQVEKHQLTKVIEKAQAVTFKFAPRFCLGVWASGTGLVAKFLVDPTVPGKACNCWVNNNASTNIQGAPLPNRLPLDSDLIATSDCFG
jgi:hypothetical protein